MRCRGWIVILLASRLWGAAAFPAPDAQERVSHVDVLLDGRAAPPEIRGLVSVKAGDRLSVRDIKDSLVRLMGTGLFSDVRVERQEVPETTLVYVLTKKLYVQGLVFPEHLRLPLRTLRAGLTSIRIGAEFREDRLPRAAEELEHLLRREGYFDSSVRASAEKDSEGGTVLVRFEIQPGRRYVISGIQVRSDLEQDQRKFLRRISSRPKRTFVPSRLEKDLQVLSGVLRQQGYQRAQVEAEEPRFDEEGKTVDLILKIRAGERIVIDIRGADVPAELVRPIWEEKIFEDWGLQEGEARILSVLRKQGYVFALVTSRVEKSGNVLRVVHEVEKGERCYVRGVRFRGLDHLTSAELEEKLGIAPGLSGRSVIDGARIFTLAEEIQDVYRSQGFPQTRVDLLFERQGRAVTVEYRVEEGPRQTVGRILFQGASLFDADRLLEEIGSRPGGAYFAPNLQTDIERLETFYLNQGIRGTKISAEVLSSVSGDRDLVFHIQEGRRVLLKDIVVTGLRDTRRATVLRELRLREGDPLFRQSVLETRRNLERLGIFQEVRLEEIPVSEDERNLLIGLREGQRNFVSFGLGMETKNIPFELAVWENVLSPRGTAEYLRQNLFGNASRFSLVGQFSLREKRGVVSIEQPYFLGRPIQNSLTAWLDLGRWYVKWRDRVSVPA